MAKKGTKKRAKKKPKSNKIQKCPHRKWVDKQLTLEVPLRKISDGLKELDPPFNASYNVISDYKKWFFNPEEKMQELLDDESDERLTEDVINKLEKVEGLKDFADWALKLKIKTDFFIDTDSGFTELDVEKFRNQIIRTGIQAQRVINQSTEHLDGKKGLKTFGDLELLKDPDWIVAKKEAMDRYYARKYGNS